MHEVLQRTDGLRQIRTVTAAGVQLDHHPDDTRSRGQYLPLLELSVKEAPEDDRNVHYLGREYFFYGRWDDCIATLQRHLAMPTATWADRRSASMRYIAKSYVRKGDVLSARRYFLRAIAEAPHLREGYMDLATVLYEQENWPGVLYFTACALEITARPDTYICEAAAWGRCPTTCGAIAFHRLGQIPLALQKAEAALALAPSDPRLQGNAALLRRAAAAAPQQ